MLKHRKSYNQNTKNTIKNVWQATDHSQLHDWFLSKVLNFKALMRSNQVSQFMLKFVQQNPFGVFPIINYILYVEFQPTRWDIGYWFYVQSPWLGLMRLLPAQTKAFWASGQCKWGKREKSSGGHLQNFILFNKNREREINI